MRARAEWDALGVRLRELSVEEFDRALEAVRQLVDGHERINRINRAIETALRAADDPLAGIARGSRGSGVGS